MSWHDRLRPASFRGVTFHVDTGSKTGGRRGPTFEFPKRDDPASEDMGRRAHQFMIAGYVIGPDYDRQAATLERALNTRGPGLLVHPTMGEMMVKCDVYTRGERRTEGGMATFDMTFTEAGTAVSERIGDPTDFILRLGASGASQTFALGIDQQLAAI